MGGCVGGCRQIKNRKTALSQAGLVLFFAPSHVDRDARARARRACYSDVQVAKLACKLQIPGHFRNPIQRRAPISRKTFLERKCAKQQRLLHGETNCTAWRNTEKHEQPYPSALGWEEGEDRVQRPR